MSYREENEMNLSEESKVLSSWKDIARYMGKGVRHFGLPVRRPNGALHKSAVLLDRSDLDAWLATRFSSRADVKSIAMAKDQPAGSPRTLLRERMQLAQELRAANHALTQEICESIRLLTQRCDRLSSQTLQAGLEQTPQTLSPPTPNR
jgi:hypothetical protein